MTPAEQRKMRSVCKRIIDAIGRVADGTERDLTEVTRETDRAHRVARYLGEEALDMITQARVTLEVAIQRGYEARKAHYEAEARRIKDEMREAQRARDVWR